MKRTNCPNCGAPITGIKCEYCGTLFYDFAEISDKHPKYLRLDFNGKKIWGKARMQSAEYIYSHDSLMIVNIQFAMIPDENGNLITYQEEE